MAEKTNDEKSSPVEQQRLEKEQIEDMGIQDYLDIYQECYDDYMAR
mgnify:CR=1 FL=1